MMEHRIRGQPQVVAVVIISLCAGVLVQLLPPDTAARLTAESGPFEIASALCYGTALAIAVVQLMRDPSRLRLASGLMLLWALLRELDFQRRFTYRSVESIPYFIRPTAPWSQKLLVLLILSPFVLAGLYLAREVCRRWLPAWKEAQPWTSYFLAVVLIGVTASLSEKVLHFNAAEEVFEAGISLLVLMLIWQTRVRPKAKPAPPASDPLPPGHSPI